MHSSALPTITHIVARVAASLLGGWVFVWGFIVLGVALLISAGMSFDEALTLANLLAFLVFLIGFCWAFTAASIVRVWIVLLGGGAAMTGAAWLLTRATG